MKQLPTETWRRNHSKKNIAEDRVYEILNSAHWGVLSTVSEDGEPYGVPISYAYDNASGDIIIHTAIRGHKIENFARDNRVCFSIVGSADLIADKFSAKYESVLVFGRIYKITDHDQAYQSAVTFCRKFAPKIVEGMEFQAAEAQIDDLAQIINNALDSMALYKIVPSHVSSKTF